MWITFVRLKKGVVDQTLDKLIRQQTPWDRRGKMLKTSIYDE